jgi:dolichyl-phosphate beta-glucosyltransferase
MAQLSNTRLSVVIPAYNEEQRLPRTLSRVLAYLKTMPFRSEVVVVNDGSTDNTEGVVRSQDPGPVTLELLRHADGANHGKGASVKRGMLEAHGDYRLFMDADNSTTLDQVERFWPYFEKGFDVAIGSRALKDSVIERRQSILKELAGRLGNLMVRLLAVPGIHDTQAGFKMFTASAAEKIFPRQTIEKWGYDVELLAIARCQGCSVCEVPITWLNAPGSKVTPVVYFEVLGEIRKIRGNIRAGLYK